MKKLSIYFVLFSVLLFASCEQDETNRPSAILGQWARISHTYSVTEGEKYTIEKPLFDQCYTYYDFRKNGEYAAYYGEGVYQKGSLTITESFEQRGQTNAYAYKKSRLVMSDTLLEVTWLDDDCLYYRVNGQGTITIVYLCKITDFIELIAKE